MTLLLGLLVGAPWLPVAALVVVAIFIKGDC